MGMKLVFGDQIKLFLSVKEAMIFKEKLFITLGWEWVRIALDR